MSAQIGPFRVFTSLPPVKDGRWGGDWTNNRGVLLRYLSGSWTPITPPYVSPGWYLSSVYFTSPSDGWAVGYDWANKRAVLLRYLSGSWTPISPPYVSENWEIYSVHFTSSGEGWAAGVDYPNKRGVLLHYLGGSWTSISPPYVSSDWALALPAEPGGPSVHFTTPNQGWAVGRDAANGRGVLLRYYTPPSARWTGTVSFPIKSTSTYEDVSENIKFQNATDTFSGTFELYAGEQGLSPNEEGCYARFAHNDGTTALCIKEATFISTNVFKSKSDQLLLIGTGDFSISLNGKDSKGGAYWDAKGTLKKDIPGQATSITISGKIAGGSNPESVFNASFNATLTK